jgi:hypothetical protein
MSGKYLMMLALLCVPLARGADTIAEEMPDAIFVRAKVTTDGTLNDGTPGRIDPGDCFPVVRYNDTHTSLQLLLITKTFWVPVERVEFVSDKDRPAAVKKYQDMAVHLMAYGRDTEKLNAAKTEHDRWVALEDVAMSSLEVGNFDDARKFAEELERLSPKYKSDRNNYADAIQDFNVVLGRLALKAGKIEEAKARLLAAGRTPGNPDLGSFGPSMSLAKELLEKKETRTVLQYFDLCRKFWKDGGEKLDEWSKAVEAGRMPDFGANLDF